MNPVIETGSGNGPISFPPTLWTIVLEAGRDESPQAEAALGELCVYYREAILGYFRLKCRHHHDAEDLSSAFVEQLLTRKKLGSFERESCPRFRVYLCKALKNFFADWIDKQHAEKRGGGRPQASVEVLGEAGFESASDDVQLDHAVDLGIVRSIHRRVMERLGDEASDRRRFEVLRSFVPYEHGRETYDDAARQLQLSPAALRKAVFDLRRNYVLHFRAAIAPSVQNVRAEVENEASELLDLLPEAIAQEDGQEAAGPFVGSSHNGTKNQSNRA